MATPDRWAPWIEPRVSASADTTINSGTNTDITGATVTFTPHINTRVLVTAAIFVRADVLLVGANDILLVRLAVNGTDQAVEVTFQPQIADSRITLAGVWTVDLVKETTYTLKLRAAINALSVGSYVVRSPHSGFVVVAMPNLHA